MEIRKFASQGVGKRFEDIFDREKAPRQPRAAVQQQSVQVEQQHEQQQQQQRETVPQQIDLPPQPFSSSHDGPMQVNTTPRRARIPDDEDNTRTIRPRLDTSALISELCERDVPEIDWEKLGEDSNYVFEIYTWLKLDAAHVKAGRETESKRMLEFGMYEEVSEEVTRGKNVWNSSWLDS